MVINHNISALNTYNKLTSNSKAAQSSLQKLSSGLRINSAADDAAGLAISQKMQAQINGLDQASTNAQNGISLVQTAEGALTETQSILQRMNNLAVQASNDTNTDSDRKAMQTEVDQLTQEIDRIANTTQFNTKTLLDGSLGITGTVGSNLTGVSIVGGSTDTQAGTTITITSMTAASAASVDATTFFTGGKATTGGTLTINDKSFTIVTASTTSADLMKAINDANIGVTASITDTGAGLTLTSTATGAGAVLKTNLFAGAVDYTTKSITDNYGANAQLSVTGATTTVDGDIATIQDGNAKGLQLKITQTNNSLTTNNTVKVDTNGGLNMQIGANRGQQMYLSISDMRSQALGVNALALDNSTDAGNAIKSLQDAIDTVSTQRANLGAYQNRLDHTINNLNTESQNLQSASSQITDVDMASEMMNYTKNNILVQSATSMLAQANQLPQSVLSLLK